MKSYTDIEQSKKLAKILPLESADYCWGIDVETSHYNSSPYPCAWKDYSCKEYYIPCWSLAALFKLMPNIGVCSPVLIKSLLESKYYCHYIGMGTHKEVHTTSFYDESIDAAFDMICWLKENGKI